MVEYSKSELAKSGSPEPVFTLSDNYCSVSFDPSGDLWEGSSANSLPEWPKAELARSDRKAAPEVTITSASLQGPCRPAFDAAGDLWAGNYNGTTVVEFTKAELARSGSRSPKVVISSLVCVGPGDVALGASGDLWSPCMTHRQRG